MVNPFLFGKTVSRVKKALMKKEILNIFQNQVEFYDTVFELWLKERYFRIVNPL